MGCVRDRELAGVPSGRGGERSDRGAGFEVAVMARVGVGCMQLSSDGVGETRTVRASWNDLDSQTSVVTVRQSALYLGLVVLFFCLGLIVAPCLVGPIVQSFCLHLMSNSFCVVRWIVGA